MKKILSKKKKDDEINDGGDITDIDQILPPTESLLSKIISFFVDDYPTKEQVIDGKNELRKHKNVVKLVIRQSYIIVLLVTIIIILMPVIQPVHKYTALRTDKAKRPMISLSMPNNTDRSVLSWAATSITEIMTFGFGDIDSRLLSQKYRFTDEGWDSFVQAIFDQGVRDRFKAQQLVLTTVPINTPVVVSKGLGEDEEYRWIVEMPIIMTYMTNNNAKDRDKAIVRLTIVRVPTSKNKAGIGIKKWRVI